MKKYTVVCAHEWDCVANDSYTEVVEADDPFTAWENCKQPKNYCCVAIFEGEQKNVVSEIE